MCNDGVEIHGNGNDDAAGLWDELFGDVDLTPDAAMDEEMSPGDLDLPPLENVTPP